MYSLAYEMLVQALRQFRYSGEVHANVSTQTPLKGGGRVVLAVQDGTVTACFIFDKNGHKVYENANALPILARLGVLDWRLMPSSSPEVMGTTHTPGTRAAFYPDRLTVPQSQIRNWSALHRSVYILADGTHSVEQIAHLLSRSQQIVEQTIGDLQSIGGIKKQQ